MFAIFQFSNNVTESYSLIYMRAPMEEHETNVKYAYFIEGGLLCLISVSFFILYLSENGTCCIHQNEMEKTEGFQTENNRTFFISFIVMIFIFYWVYCILELTYANYLTTYVVDELGWTKTTGASLTSVYWGIFTLGRIIGIFIVKYISVEMLLLSSTSLTILSLIPEVFFAHFHYSIMWISTVLFGLFISTIYASGLTFANMYVPFSGGVGSVFVAAGSLGALTGPVFVVSLFGTYGMQVFVVLLFVCSIIDFLVFLGAWLMGRKHGKRNMYIKI